MDYRIAALTPETWALFAALAEKHNGVWGGCWCVWFHPLADRSSTNEDNRSHKQRLVEEGRAHAALVVAGGAAVGWCEYGTPEELPHIYYRKEYEAGPPAPADYRITCFFIDRDHRRRGVAGVALRGAVDLVASAGGGIIESSPHDTQGAKTSASFLHNGTRTLFERHGFVYERPIGKSRCVVRLEAPPGGSVTDGGRSVL